MNAVTLTHVERRLGGFALGPLSLEVPRGAVTAFIGPNGAGKTTTLDLIMGLGTADAGGIEVLGFSMPRDEVAIKSRVAYVSPDLNYTAWGKVGRVLDFVRGFYPDWNAARCTQLMQEFGIARGEGIAALSFGARIKLSLVIALARDAELLVLDEPTVGLDVNARQVLFREILDFVKRDDRAVLISSHQLSDLERLADYVALINRGKLVTMGRMDALVGRYVQVDAAMANGALPRLDGIKILDHDGDWCRLLLDRKAIEPSALAARGFTVTSETPMTLEEVFLALVDKP
ncbi:MAG TPA: ABC transporter ATP-binding protein [Rhizomicrobium sp.]|jgi:ABC-2 type transport system ATP-binding protein|nr:ABC transporter ATP-binding protein [Rhizomicrobium sp.]